MHIWKLINAPNVSRIPRWHDSASPSGCFACNDDICFSLIARRGPRTSTREIHDRLARTVSRVAPSWAARRSSPTASTSQPIGINHPHWISPSIAIGIGIAIEADGVGLDVSARARVVIAILVVIEIGEQLLLPREPERCDGGERGCSSAGVIAAHGHAKVVGVEVVQLRRRCGAIAGHHG
jgi:hypothetical protein